MKRRQLLRRAGALAAVGVAGCVGDDGTGDGTDTTTEPNSPTTDPGTTPPGTDRPTTTRPEPPTDTRAAPKVTGSSIETLGTSCRSDGAAGAAVAFQPGPSTVTVTGTLQTSTPCYAAEIAALDYDRDSDTLTVRVGATETGGTCVQCLGAVEYEATVEFMAALPDTVEVVHDGQTVARAEQGTPTPSPGPGTPASIASRSLRVTDVSQSARQETADVVFEEEASTVRITGVIEGSDGCKTAALGEVEYDASEDHLAVDVVTEDREDAGDTCTEALIYLTYEVEVVFEGDLPGSAAVSHDGDGLVSAAWGSASASAPTDTSG